jgi:hypothetical protein
MALMVTVSQNARADVTIRGRTIALPTKLPCAIGLLPTPVTAAAAAEQLDALAEFLLATMYGGLLSTNQKDQIKEAYFKRVTLIVEPGLALNHGLMAIYTVTNSLTYGSLKVDSWVAKTQILSRLVLIHELIIHHGQYLALTHTGEPSPSPATAEPMGLRGLALRKYRLYSELTAHAMEWLVTKHIGKDIISADIQTHVLNRQAQRAILRSVDAMGVNGQNALPQYLEQYLFNQRDVDYLLGMTDFSEETTLNMLGAFLDALGWLEHDSR